MKKILALVVFIWGIALGAHAQSTATTTETVDANLTDVIELDFVGTGTSSSSVSLPLANVTQLASGVTSSAQQLVVLSTRNFNIAVKANATNFTYSGTATPTPVMPVNGILKVEVTANTSGGAIGAGFTTYKNITTANQNIITNGVAGGNQGFSIQYQASPGFTYKGGTYTIGVVYTATQL